MSFLFALLAAGSLPTIINGAPLQHTHFSKRAVNYVQFTGSGESWPAQNSWMDFDSMFDANKDIMSGSCTQFSVANPSDSEISDMKSAIQSVGSSSGVDPRFILAVVMQESNGCVRAPTTNYGVRNPGLMQDHDGSGTCNDGGSVQNPCPSSQITQMITDGVEGTSAGDGLKQCIAQAGTDDVSKYYRAARIYNSGSVTDDNLSAGVATHCYASDIANRLTGWTTAPHDCNLDGADVPVNTGSPAQSTSAPTSTYSQPSAPSTPAASTPTTTAAPTTSSTPTYSVPSISTPAFSGFSGLSSLGGFPTQSADASAGSQYSAPADNGAKAAASPTAAAESGSMPALVTSSSSVPQPTSTAASTPAASSASSSSSSSSSAPLGPGVSSSCPQLYTVQDDDNCWTLGKQFGFSLSQFQSWNTQIDDQCSNLWKGYQYCVKGQ